MASTKNAFELLLGATDQPIKAAGKKKGKKKKPAAPEAEGSAPAVQSQQVAVEVEDDDGDFQPVPQSHVVKARAAAPEAKAVKEAAFAKASDACAALEREAAAATGSDRSALASKWAGLVRQAPAGPKYAYGEKQLDFKQVLLKSRALDQLVAGYLSGCAASDAAPLSALLAAAAHPSAPADLPCALAAAVVGLGQLATTDPLSVSADAQHSVAASLGLVKAGVPHVTVTAAAAESPATLLGSLGSKLEKLEAQLPKTTALKEQVRLWGDIFATTQQKLDMVKGAGAARPPPEVGAALGPLQSLQGALASRIKEVQRAKSGASIESQLARAEGIYKEEEAAMQARLSDVEGRVKALEAELAELRQEAVQLRDRRTWAAQHHQQLLAKIKSGAEDSAAAEADLQSGLQAVEGLRQALQGTAARSAPAQDTQGLGQQLVAKEVPGKFMGAVQAVMELGVKLLQEMAGKAQFYRDRLAQAVRQGEHLAMLKMSDSKQQEEFKKQTDNLRKMLQDVLASAESVAKTCQGAAAAYRTRLGLMLALPNFPPPPPEFGSHLEALAAQASQLLHSILSEQQPPAAAAVPAEKKPTSRSTSPEKPRRAPVAPATVASAPAPAVPLRSAELASLEQRLAQLEEQNRQKDAQIAALLSTATMEVPSPLPAMLGTPPPAAALGLPPAAQALAAAPPQPVFPTATTTEPSLFVQPPAALSTPLTPVTQAPAVQLEHLDTPVATAAEVLAEPAPPVPAPAPPANWAQALAAGRGRGPSGPRA